MRRTRFPSTSSVASPPRLEHWRAESRGQLGQKTHLTHHNCVTDGKNMETSHCSETAEKEIPKDVSVMATPELSPPSGWQKILSQSVPAYRHASLDRPADCLCNCCVNKVRCHVVLENGKALSGSADRTVSSDWRGSVHFACLSVQTYLAAGDRSVAAKKRNWCEATVPVFFKSWTIHAQNTNTAF